MLDYLVQTVKTTHLRAGENLINQITSDKLLRLKATSAILPQRGLK